MQKSSLKVTTFALTSYMQKPLWHRVVNSSQPYLVIDFFYAEQSVGGDACDVGQVIRPENNSL